MKNPYRALGLNEDSSVEDANKAFKKFSKKLSPDAFSDDSTARKQAERCLTSMKKALVEIEREQKKLAGRASYERLEALPPQIGESHPRIGQMCLASGMITAAQLKEAVDYQRKADLSLGQILLAKQFISQSELDGLLLGQELIDIPASTTDPLSQQLVSLGLMTEDMAFVIELDRKSRPQSVEDLIISRGWIEEKILRQLSEAATTRGGDK